MGVLRLQQTRWRHTQLRSWAVVNRVVLLSDSDCQKGEILIASYCKLLASSVDCGFMVKDIPVQLAKHED